MKSLAYTFSILCTQKAIIVISNWYVKIFLRCSKGIILWRISSTGHGENQTLRAEYNTSCRIQLSVPEKPCAFKSGPHQQVPDGASYSTCSDFSKALDLIAGSLKLLKFPLSLLLRSSALQIFMSAVWVALVPSQTWLQMGRWSRVVQRSQSQRRFYYGVKFKNLSMGTVSGSKILTKLILSQKNGIFISVPLHTFTTKMISKSIYYI